MVDFIDSDGKSTLLPDAPLFFTQPFKVYNYSLDKMSGTWHFEIHKSKVNRVEFDENMEAKELPRTLSDLEIVNRCVLMSLPKTLQNARADVALRIVKSKEVPIDCGKSVEVTYQQILVYENVEYEIKDAVVVLRKEIDGDMIVVDSTLIHPNAVIEVPSANWFAKHDSIVAKVKVLGTEKLDVGVIFERS